VQKWKNRVCGKTLAIFVTVGEDLGSAVETRFASRLSHVVAPPPTNRGRMIGNLHAFALLVLRNLKNVARDVGGWFLHSHGSSPISGGGHGSTRV